MQLKSLKVDTHKSLDFHDTTVILDLDEHRRTKAIKKYFLNSLYN